MSIHLKTVFSILLLFLTIACSLSLFSRPTPTLLQPTQSLVNDRGSQRFENDQVSFDYPGDWRTLEEIFGRTSGQTRDKEFDADILIVVTNAIPSAFGEKYTAWCTLLKRPIKAGQELTKLVNGSYAILKNYPDSELSLQEITLNGDKAIEKIYKRPRGEPWYQVRDVWIQKNGTIFILSCYSSPSDYDKNAPLFDEILNSIKFK